MTSAKKPGADILAENNALRLRLEEAEETLRAIGNGEVDAFVVAGPQGRQIFTLKGAEQPYRVLVETMNEGAATLSADGSILYCNGRLASLLQIPLERLMGKKLATFVAPADRPVFSHRLESGAPEHGSLEILMLSEAGNPVPVLLSFCFSELSGSRGTSVVLTDLTQQKRNEEIIASAGLARSIIEQAGEAILVCDAQGNIIQASQIACQLCGASPLQREFDELFPLRIKGSEVPFSVRPTLSGGSIRSLQVEYRPGAGEGYHLILNAQPLFDTRDQINGCVVSLTDITELKRAEAAQHESELRFRLATEATGVGIWEWHISTKRIRFDIPMFRIYGIPPTEDGWLPFQHWSEAILPEDLPSQEELLQDADRGGGLTSREFRIRRAGDGELRVIRAVGTLRKNAQGEIEWMVGTNLDITESTQAIEAKAALAAIVEYSEDAIISKSLDGTVTSWNHGAERLFGYRCDEMLGQPVTRIIPAELQAEESAILESLRGGRSIAHYETMRLTKGGTHIPVSLTISPIRHASGAIIGASKIARDITERKRAEEELNAQRRHLEELNQELENRVADRTRELAATIGNLKAEIAEREIAEANLLRLNRLYLVLSETNHAIVCTKDRDLLLSEICRVAVEDGGFRLAWAGLVDGQSGELRVAASHGACGYLDDIGSALCRDPLRVWPTSISVRMDTHCICNNFLGSLITSPWQEAGAAHGIASAASIPLKLEGAVIGALTLYSEDKDFFDQQQISLLQQLGADFSFALDNIHRETRRKEVERALYEQTEKRLQTVEALRLKEQMLVKQSRQAAMGEMIGNIAHQWRQPLNNLALSIQEVKMMHELGLCTDAYMKQSVKKSMELIQHMSQTIDDFRDYFKPDKEKTDFEVAEVIANTLQLIEDSFKHQHIQIEIVTRQAPVVRGYRNEFAQSLLNILNNARDALTERKIEHPKVTVCVSGEGDRAVVTVTDNAGGIPPEIIDKIFDPYFTTKGPNAGTGLGLFMSKTIVEKNLGGSLTVRNAGNGAEFRIEV